MPGRTPGPGCCSCRACRARLRMSTPRSISCRPGRPGASRLLPSPPCHASIPTALPGEAREVVRPPTLRWAVTTTTPTVPKSATSGAGPASLAPDLVIEVRAEDSAKWEVNEAAEALAAALDAAPVLPPDGFVGAIGRGVPEGIGSVPGVRLTAGLEEAPAELDRLWPLLSGGAAPSSARVELDRRRARSPVEIGRALASAYGRTIEPVVYTQGVAISGRLRLAALEPDSPSPAAEIAALVEPLADRASAFRDGREVGISENSAAFVWGDELAEAVGDRRFSDILVEAAGRYSRQGPGQAPPPARPNFPTEDHFFVSAVLGRGYLAHQRRVAHRYSRRLPARRRDPAGKRAVPAQSDGARFTGGAAMGSRPSAWRRR